MPSFTFCQQIFSFSFISGDLIIVINYASFLQFNWWRPITLGAHSTTTLKCVERFFEVQVSLYIFNKALYAVFLTSLLDCFLCEVSHIPTHPSWMLFLPMLPFNFHFPFLYQSDPLYQSGEEKSKLTKQILDWKRELSTYTFASSFQSNLFNERILWTSTHLSLYR